MKRTHQGNGSGCRWAAKHAGAWAAGIAVVWTVLAPSAAQGQSAVWLPQGATSGKIYYNGGNVGVGTSGPLSEMMIGGGGGYATIGYSAYFDGSTWHGSGMEMTFGPTTMMIGSIASGQPTMLAYFTNSGDVAMGLLNGRVGIGTTNLGTYKLAVNGTIGAQDIIVTNTGWSDYVFQPGYRLRPLNEVDQFIRQHGHLPEIPSEKEVKDKGVSVGEMQAKLLAKVEELTLHLIQQEKEKDELRARLADLEHRLAANDGTTPDR